MKRNCTPTLRRGLSMLVITALLAGLAMSTALPPPTRAAPPPASPQGDQWQELFPATAPAPRYGHSMFAFGGNAYLFGGAIQGSFVPQNDLWALDRQNLTWIQLTSTNTPSARYSHSASGLGSKMYMFGGVDSSNQTLGEFWVYETRVSSWEQLTGGPPARKLHSSVVLESAGKLVIIGGKDANDTPLSDVWAYDLETDAWQQKTSYPGEGIYDFATSAYNNKVYIMGKDNNQMGVYDFDVDTWSSISVTPAPPARRGAGYTYYENKAWIIGGQDVVSGNALNDTWEYDFETGSWVQREDMPMPLMELVATYLYIQPTRSPKVQRALEDSWILVFGGIDSNGQLQGRTFRYTPPTGPAPTATPTVTPTATPAATPTITPTPTPIPSAGSSCR